MLHVVGLTLDEGTKVKHNTLRFVSLAHDGAVSVLQCSKLLLVLLPLTLELLSDLLLKHKRFESIITLLLSTRQSDSKPCGIVLLLIDETGEAAVLTLVVLNFDLEILGFLGELLGESLELEELLLPALKLLDQEVVSLSNLTELAVQALLEVDEVSPGFLCVTRVLVALADNLVQVAHRHLSHQWLLDGASKYGLHSSVAALMWY